MAKLTKVEKARRARIKAGKAKPSDVHTSTWWSRRYREAKKYAASKGIAFPFQDRRGYINAYLSVEQGQKASAAAMIRKEIRTSVPDSHSIQFFDYQYQRMQRYAKEKGVAFPYRSRREFISDYRAIKMSGSKRPLDEMRYFLKYKTSYRVARAEYKMAKEQRQEWLARKAKHEENLAKFRIWKGEEQDIQDRLDYGERVDQDEIDDLYSRKPEEEPEEFDEEEPEEYTFRELQNMDVREFAERNKDLLRQAYHEQREAGKSSKEAKQYISTNWFGSP